jgi:UDP-glucose 4-epimerase
MKGIKNFLKIGDVMKVLITGGAGFIGSMILEEVLTKGWEPIIVDNLSAGNISTIPKGVPFYQIDIRSHNLEEVFRLNKPEIVIHQAAQISVEYSKHHPKEDCEINIVGTINLLDLCVKYKVSKFIFASSAAVYGATKNVPILETNELKPISFYGLSKWMSEQYIKLYHNQHGLSYTILRYSNVYGVGQNPLGEAGVISIFTNKIIKHQPLTVYGEGSQTRDFIFVRDVAKANLQAVSFGDNKTFNISTGKPISLNRLIEHLKNITQTPIEIKYEPARLGDIKESFLSNDLAKKLLNWEPKACLEAGLEETWDSWSQ